MMWYGIFSMQWASVSWGSVSSSWEFPVHLKAQCIYAGTLQGMSTSRLYKKCPFPCWIWTPLINDTQEGWCCTVLLFLCVLTYSISDGYQVRGERLAFAGVRFRWAESASVSCWVAPYFYRRNKETLSERGSDQPCAMLVFTRATLC